MRPSQTCFFLRDQIDCRYGGVVLRGRVRADVYIQGTRYWDR